MAIDRNGIREFLEKRSFRRRGWLEYQLVKGGKVNGRALLVTVTVDETPIGSPRYAYENYTVFVEVRLDGSADDRFELRRQAFHAVDAEQFSWYYGKVEDELSRFASTMGMTWTGDRTDG